jgi:hypothetical protein
VLALEKNQAVSPKSITLKDLDFLKLEKKMYINSRVAARCSMAIEKDAIFFRNCNIIDYSLIVFKINWIKYTIDNDCDMD